MIVVVNSFDYFNKLLRDIKLLQTIGLRIPFIRELKSICYLLNKANANLKLLTR